MSKEVLRDPAVSPVQGDSILSADTGLLIRVVNVQRRLYVHGTVVESIETEFVTGPCLVHRQPETLVPVVWRALVTLAGGCIRDDGTRYKVVKPRQMVKDALLMSFAFAFILGTVAVIGQAVLIALGVLP